MGWFSDWLHDVCCIYIAGKTMENGGDARADILEATFMKDAKKEIGDDIIS